MSGLELKLFRIRLGVQAKEIASVLGVSKSFVSNMERGVKNIPKDKYILWFGYLKSLSK